MDITDLVASKEAEAKAKEESLHEALPLAEELQALLNVLPQLEVKVTTKGQAEKFLSLPLVFEGSKRLTPFFGLVYALRILPEDAVKKAESLGLFNNVRVKVSSWERGAISVSFFQKEAEPQPQSEAGPKRDTNRGR